VKTDDLWSRHSAEWRDPAQIAAHWEHAGHVDPALLRMSVHGPWWDVLAEHRITVLVTREYEHLVVAMTTVEGRPYTSYMRMPHPSGLAVNVGRAAVYIASTRNPNHVYMLVPASAAGSPTASPPLIPIRSAFYPGSLYIHDLALVGGNLHANAVGHNAVVRLRNGAWEHVWWPAAIERNGRPDFGRNYLQLNSIAESGSIERSFFSASAAEMSSRRPGHLNFPVDGRGVIFSGKTREPIVTGLTRPHSARLRGGRELWVDNSGYGELRRISGNTQSVVATLPGWTRGLCFSQNVAFVGTSRVIPRFRAYAPGLDVDRSRCGVHAVDVSTGRVVASASWPRGNQVFAVEIVPDDITSGFPFTSRTNDRAIKELFYSFDVNSGVPSE
jgi:uncharacterized protein (TIGR03032 family)